MPLSRVAISSVSALLAIRRSDRQRVARKLADREQRPVQRARRNDRVDARAVGKARVHPGLRFVDPAPDGGDDAVDDSQQMALALEAHRRRLEDAVPLHEHLPVRVDQDVGDRRILEQRLQRAQAQDLVEQLLDQETELLGVERRALGREQLIDDRGDLAPQVRLGDLLDGSQVQLLEQALVQARLEVEPAAQLIVLLRLVPVRSGEFRSRRRAILDERLLVAVVARSNFSSSRSLSGRAGRLRALLHALHAGGGHLPKGAAELRAPAQLEQRRAAVDRLERQPGVVRHE